MQEKKTLPFKNIDLRCSNKIIPFPGALVHKSVYHNRKKQILDFPETSIMEIYRKTRSEEVQGIILARPGEKLPKTIQDFRPLLQRDGLILLSWDKRFTEKGILYTAYWVTSSGVLRYYASLPLYAEDFFKAMPNRKSYAAEDGIDFYGEAGPVYIVHVAPELMMSNNQKLIQRPEHIKKLKALGVCVDFDYSFLLTTERKKKPPRHTKKRDSLHKFIYSDA